MNNRKILTSLYFALLIIMIITVVFISIKTFNYNNYQNTNCYINSTQIIAQKITKNNLFRLEVVYHSDNNYCSKYKTGNSYNDLELYAEMINAEQNECYKFNNKLFCNKPKRIKDPWLLATLIFYCVAIISYIRYIYVQLFNTSFLQEYNPNFC